MRPEAELPTPEVVAALRIIPELQPLALVEVALLLSDSTQHPWTKR
jgi:hypothetical protein